MYEYFDGLYFFTATCNNWQNFLQAAEYQQIIFDSLTHFTENELCSIYGFVIMPNHIHLVIGILPENTKSFQQQFLKYTSQQIIRAMKKTEAPLLNKMISTQSDRAYHFWERRPKWKSIMHTDMFWQKLRYIHNNPLQGKWSLVSSPQDYSASSASSYIDGVSHFDFLKLWDSE